MQHAVQCRQCSKKVALIRSALVSFCLFWPCLTGRSSHPLHRLLSACVVLPHQPQQRSPCSTALTVQQLKRPAVSLPHSLAARMQQAWVLPCTSQQAIKPSLCAGARVTACHVAASACSIRLSWQHSSLHCVHSLTIYGMCCTCQHPLLCE